MAHLAAIQIGPCKSLDPSTFLTTTSSRTPAGLSLRLIEGASREDLATATQIVWWQHILGTRSTRLTVSPRLAHRTGFYSAWDLVEVDGRWVICLAVWEIGQRRTARNTTTVFIGPRQGDPHLDRWGRNCRSEGKARMDMLP